MRATCCPFTHADTWNVGLSYENPQGWYGALFLNSVSNFFVDRANEESLTGRTTLDFKLRVPITSALALNASVNNIFDTQYEEFPGFPGVGRTFRWGSAVVLMEREMVEHLDTALLSLTLNPSPKGEGL